jgi:hypothetical protein
MGTGSEHSIGRSCEGAPGRDGVSCALRSARAAATSAADARGDVSRACTSGLGKRSRKLLGESVDSGDALNCCSDGSDGERRAPASVMGAVVGSGGSAEVGAERNAWLRARHDDERAVELEYWRGESCGRCCCGSGGRRVSELPSVGESPRLEWVLAWPCERCCWRRCCGGGGAEEDEAAALPGGGPLRRAEAAAAGEGVRWCERGGSEAERCPPARDGGGGAGCCCCGTPADMVRWWREKKKQQAAASCMPAVQGAGAALGALASCEGKQTGAPSVTAHARRAAHRASGRARPALLGPTLTRPCITPQLPASAPLCSDLAEITQPQLQGAALSASSLSTGGPALWGAHDAGRRRTARGGAAARPRELSFTTLTAALRLASPPQEHEPRNAASFARTVHSMLASLRPRCRRL